MAELEYEPEVVPAQAASLLLAHGVDSLAVEEDLARVWREDAGQAVQQGGLAGIVQDPDDLLPGAEVEPGRVAGARREAAACQVLAKVRFNQAPTAPIYVGGALITVGGMIIAFWRA